MKFRATLVEVAAMRQFSNIVNTLSKLSKICVLRICEDRLYFILPDEHYVPCRIALWSVLHKNEFFNTYTMKGDTEKNEIFLEFSSDMLASSLSSLKAGTGVISLKIKLTHKISPCITLELQLASPSSSSQTCIHDVPVVIIGKKDWSDYQEPTVTDFNVSIQMPNTRTVKNIVDKLKKMCNKVTITASTKGTFSLLAKTSSASIEIHFKDLIVKKLPRPAPDPLASVCLDIKKIAQFLTCDSLHPSVMVCNIVKEHMLHLSLSHTGFVLNYYVMAVEE